MRGAYKKPEMLVVLQLVHLVSVQPVASSQQNYFLIIHFDSAIEMAAFNPIP